MKFDIKRSGFDVVIGEVNFFFSTSEDNLLRLIDWEEISGNQMRLIDDELGKFNLENMEEPEEFKQALNVAKSKVKMLYDDLLGEGSFDKLYAAYPDLIQLYTVYQDVLNGVLEEMEKIATENKKKSSLKVEKLKEKAAKKKKSK